MTDDPSVTALLRKPAAWVPIVIALLALALVLGVVAVVGVVREEDEGTAAHLFQLLMVTNALAVAYFGLRWLPEAPKPAIVVLALQIAVAAIPLAIVFFLEL